MVAEATAESEELKNERVQFEDRLGGSGANSEPDVAMMLNPARRVERTHGAEVIFLVVKNCLGASGGESRYTLLAGSVSYSTNRDLSDVHPKNAAMESAINWFATNQLACAS